MYAQDVLDALLDRVYEAMLDRSLWPSFLSTLAAVIGGTLPILFLHDTSDHSGAFAISVGYDPVTLRAYREHLSAINVWVRSGIRLLVPGMVRTSHMMCSRRELLRSQWWTDFCRPLAISQGIGATILNQGTMTYNVSVLADDRRGEIGEDEKHLFRMLMPHMQRALTLHMHLAEHELRRNSFMEALDRVPVGILLVHGDGRVAYLNGAAQRIVEARNGLFVDLAGIRLLRSRDTERLRRLIGEATLTTSGRATHAGGAMRAIRMNGLRPLEIVVSPTRAEETLSFFARPFAIVCVSDPELLPQDLEALARQRYALTAAEARVAALIAQGKPVAEVAERLGVTRNTVKTQLQSVFRKTNTQRQAELTRLLLGDAGMVSAALQE